jgi:glycosyltransferase involved in cell wall biosynthesis
MSPAAYYAARREDAAVVQTLHNYRLICPSAVLFRDGHVCEECVGKHVPWPGVMHGCYRGSRPATAAVAAMLTVHGAAHTYDRAVDRYIALTEFSRQKFIAGGLPGERIAVKPNFVAPDPGPGAGDGRYALYVGTLVPGKGVETMLRAWEIVGHGLPLKIVGDGELGARVRDAASANPAIQWLGRRKLPEVYALMGRATCLVFPSLWYENMPKTIVEAYAKGTPVVASKIGAMVDLIDHGRTGLHFTPGDPQDLAAQVRRLVAEQDEYPRRRGEARRAYEAKFTPQANYEVLSRVYHEAVAARRGSAGA